ncbi:MAG: hypothetical protein AAB323_01965 [Pseudomonadota bacterium]
MLVSLLLCGASAAASAAVPPKEIYPELSFSVNGTENKLSGSIVKQIIPALKKHELYSKEFAASSGTGKIDWDTMDHKAEANGAASLTLDQFKELFSKHTGVKTMRLKAAGADTAMADAKDEVQEAKNAMAPLTAERDSLKAERDLIAKKLQALSTEYASLVEKAKELDAEVVRLTPAPRDADLVAARSNLTAAQQTYTAFVDTLSDDKKATASAIDWTTGDLADALNTNEMSVIINLIPNTLSKSERTAITTNQLAIQSAQRDVNAKSVPPRAPAKFKSHTAILGAVTAE